MQIILGSDSVGTCNSLCVVALSLDMCGAVFGRCFVIYFLR